MIEAELDHLLTLACEGPPRLPAAGDAASAAPVAVARPSKLAADATFLPAGRAFERRWRICCGLGDPEESDDEDEDEEGGGDAGGAGGRAEAEAKRWEGFREADVDEGDMYALLNLKDREVSATTEEVHRAWKKASIVCHPDKSPPETRAAAESRFKAMQIAFDTLSSPALKRGYDSSLEFDDSVPGPGEGRGDGFYRVYEPVFRRNERFSTNHPVPQLGGPDTPYAEVDRFYDFWLSFHSWREFAHLNEHKLESASCREEKRMFQRENAKAQQTAKRAEAARVRAFVERAMEMDPRVVKHREEERLAKEAKKQEKKEAKRRHAAQKARQAEIAVKAAQDEAQRIAASRERKKASNANAKQWRKQVRKAVRSGKYVEWPAEDLELVVEHIDVDDLGELAAAVNGAEDGCADAYTALQHALEAAQDARDVKAQKMDERIAAERLKKRRDKEEIEAKAEWTLEENSTLAKAVQKFPAGVKRRWEFITEAVNAHSRRTTKEVIARVRQMDHEKAKPVGDDAAFRLYLEKRKDAKLSPEEEKAEAEAAAKAEADAAAAAEAALKERADADAAKEATAKRRRDSAKRKADANEWSAEQQAQLENALRTVPKDGADRWAKVSMLVDGKNLKQCVRRFKEIRAQIKKKGKK